mmetsp:Transcript_33467/g.84319  ORF Transcript_33467/g.84319 Transcript_33467/m.84319 type:complete len:269 (+) Transcript_33467:1378-2184(+)
MRFIRRRRRVCIRTSRPSGSCENVCLGDERERRHQRAVEDGIRIFEEHDVGVHAHDAVAGLERAGGVVPLLRPQQEHVAGLHAPRHEARVRFKVRAPRAPLHAVIGLQLHAQRLGGGEQEVVVQLQTAEVGDETSDEPDGDDAQRRVFVYPPMVPSIAHREQHDLLIGCARPGPQRRFERSWYFQVHAGDGAHAVAGIIAADGIVSIVGIVSIGARWPRRAIAATTSIGIGGGGRAYFGRGGGSESVFRRRRCRRCLIEEGTFGGCPL